MARYTEEDITEAAVVELLKSRSGSNYHCPFCPRALTHEDMSMHARECPDLREMVEYDLCAAHNPDCLCKVEGFRRNTCPVWKKRRG